jgi:hypothetical protein
MHLLLAESAASATNDGAVPFKRDITLQQDLEFVVRRPSAARAWA